MLNFKKIFQSMSVICDVNTRTVASCTIDATGLPWFRFRLSAAVVTSTPSDEEASKDTWHLEISAALHVAMIFASVNSLSWNSLSRRAVSRMPIMTVVESSVVLITKVTPVSLMLE